MKKNILVTLLIVFCAANISAQVTFTWTGGGGDNNWKTGSNWSNTSPTPNLSPVSSSTNNFVFNGSASVKMDVSTFYSLGSLTVNSGAITLTTDVTGEMLLSGPLTIASGATLLFDGAARMTITQNVVACTASISGTLELAGSLTSTTNARIQGYSTFSGAQPLWTVNSGGKVILSGANAQINGMTNDRMAFESGATLEITRSGGTIPDCNYKSGSLIRVIGTGATGATLPSNASVRYDGDVEWNRPNQAAETTLNWPVSSIPDINGKITMKAGYLNIGGSSNTRLTNGTFKIGAVEVQGGIFSIGSTVNGSATISGNATVSGGTFRVGNPSFSGGMIITVNGDVTQSGGTIDISTNSGNGKLTLKGNLNQTAGTLTETGTGTTPSLTFGGASIQNATFSGTVSGNNFIVITDNNSSHVNLLSSVSLPYRLQCTSGNVILGNNNLTVTEKVLGSRTGGGVVTNGTGSLTLKNVDNVGKNFPVRFSNASHDPVYITNTTGTADFTVRVANTVSPGGNLNFLNLRARQWEIASTSAAANLEFEPDPLAGTTPAAGSRSIARYNGSVWVQSAAVEGPNNGYPYSANFTAFSSFVVGETSVIPVELVNFKAKYTNNSNTLTWQTASERNAQQFDIQRSADGVSDWTTIGSVKAQGNSQALLSYQFADETPLRLSYYRLRTLDFDGKTQVSKTVSINRQVNGKLSLGSISSLYTEGGTLTFDINLIERTNLNITLTDAAGRAILTKNYATVEGNNQIQLNTTGLAKGVYIVNIADGQSSVAVKMVKQ